MATGMNKGPVGNPIAVPGGGAARKPAGRASPAPVWDPRQGVYSVKTGPQVPGGKVYYNPQSGQTFYVDSGGQPQSMANAPANEQSYWNKAFAPIQGQAPGTTDTGQQFQGNKLMQSPQGTYYYQQGGRNYALNADQLKGLNLPNIAGYDQAGNPYYS